MTVECEIEFENNPLRVIYAGRFLNGTVHLTVKNEEKTIRGVYLKINGNAHCHWSRGVRKFKKSCSADEKFFCEVIYLIGSSDGEMQLLPGSYDYPFKCYLPSQLPTSFEGRYGHIRYTACVVLNIPTWPDKEFEVLFSVIKEINLNADPKLRTAVTVEKESTFYHCCLLCCCESRPLEMVARVPVGAYAPGQTINVELAVRNRSDVLIAAFTVQLIKKVTYQARGRKKVQTMVITGEEKHGCDVNEDIVIKAHIRVPAIPPTDHTASNMIKVHYYCRVTGSVDLCHDNPVLQIPIVIGTYPIHDAIEEQLARTSIASTPTHHSAHHTNGDVDPQPGNSSNPTDPLLSSQHKPRPSASIQFPCDEHPTYEDAPLFGKHVDREFVPKYPMFKRRTAYSQHPFYH